MKHFILLSAMLMFVSTCEKSCKYDTPYNAENKRQFVKMTVSYGDEEYVYETYRYNNAWGTDAPAIYKYVEHLDSIEYHLKLSCITMGDDRPYKQVNTHILALRIPSVKGWPEGRTLRLNEKDADYRLFFKNNGWTNDMELIDSKAKNIKRLTVQEGTIITSSPVLDQQRFFSIHFNFLAKDQNDVVYKLGGDAQSLQ